MRRWAFALAALFAGAAAEAASVRVLPDSITASAEERRYPAAAALDGLRRTRWRGALGEGNGTAATLSFSTQDPVDVASFTVTNWIDADAPSQSPSSFTLEGRADASDAWAVIRTVENSVGWGHAETRAFYTTDDAPAAAFNQFRLRISGVQGGPGGKVAISELQLRPRSSDALCSDRIYDLAIGATVSFEPGPKSSFSNAPQEAMLVTGVRLANEGAVPLLLKTLEIPIAFNSTVRPRESLPTAGSTRVATPVEFSLECVPYTAAVVRDARGRITERASACEDVFDGSFVSGDGAGSELVVRIKADVELPPGAVLDLLSGSLLRLRHNGGLALDPRSVTIGAARCSDVVEALAESFVWGNASAPLPPRLAQAHPACQGWLGTSDAPVPPASPPESCANKELAALDVAVTSSRVPYSTPKPPPRGSPAPTIATPDNVTDWSIETMLGLEVRNKGTGDVNLRGLVVRLPLPLEVFQPLANASVTARPDEYMVTCRYGAVFAPEGWRVEGDADLCTYMQLVVEEEGFLALRFLGGTLCPRCVLSTFDGILLSLKHVDLLPMASAGALAQAVVGCERLDLPPAFCGAALGGVQTQTRSSALDLVSSSACARSGDLRVNLTVAAKPVEVATPRKKVADSDRPEDEPEPGTLFQLHLRPRVENLGTAPISLDGLTVPVAFSRRVFSESLGWIERPPEEWSAQCWWAQVTGPRPPTDVVCAWMEVEPTDEGFTLRFTGGVLCAGCTLSGGMDGTTHVLMQDFRLPIEASTAVVGAPSFCAAADALTEPEGAPDSGAGSAAAAAA